MEILRESAGKGLELVKPVLTGERLLELREQTRQLHVSDNMNEYIVNLTEETRKDPRIALGVSPRGSIALLKMARAMALIRGGEYVIPEDVLSVIPEVWAHRIHLNAMARAEGTSIPGVIREITERIRAV